MDSPRVQVELTDFSNALLFSGIGSGNNIFEFNVWSHLLLIDFSIKLYINRTGNWLDIASQIPSPNGERLRTLRPVTRFRKLTKIYVVRNLSKQLLYDRIYISHSLGALRANIIVLGTSDTFDGTREVGKCCSFLTTYPNGRWSYLPTSWWCVTCHETNDCLFIQMLV